MAAAYGRSLLASAGRGLTMLLLSSALAAAATAAQVPDVPPIGANKFDLMLQYLGTASRCRHHEPCRRVTEAMARKSMQDARDAGIRFFRISTSGAVAPEGGAGDSLAMWRDSPAEFWRRTDMMMDDLDNAGIQIVPVLMWGAEKFPHITGETTARMLTDPESASWRMLERFVTEFVGRYKTRKTVLFYELTNAFNKSADLDHVRRCQASGKRLCEVSGNFTTDQLIAFTERFAKLVRRLDGSRLISSGFAMPREQAEHLRARPQWSPGGADWTPDGREQFAKNLTDIHRHVDIISVHFYGGERNSRFGSGNVIDLLEEAKRAADAAGKPLFVGEFGEVDSFNATEQTHVSKTIRKVRELRIPFAAVWVWEFYQQSTYSTQANRPNRMNVEPGYTDFLIDRIRQANVSASPALARASSVNAAPRVVLTYPFDCDVLAEGRRTVHAVASDDSGKVDRVEFWLGDRKLAVDTTAPYETVIPSGTQNGELELKAVAFDASGKQSEFKSRVQIGAAPAARTTCGVSPRK